MAKRRGLGTSPVLSWIKQTDVNFKDTNRNKIPEAPKISKKAKKQIGILTNKQKDIKVARHISKLAIKQKDNIANKQAPIVQELGPHVKEKSITTPKVSGSPERKVHTTIKIDEKLWLGIKERAIHSDFTVSEYVARELTRKADMQINKPSELNSGLKGGKSLSLYLPSSLLVSLKLQALRLRVPYPAVIIKKLQ